LISENRTYIVDFKLDVAISSLLYENQASTLDFKPDFAISSLKSKFRIHADNFEFKSDKSTCSASNLASLYCLIPFSSLRFKINLLSPFGLFVTLIDKLKRWKIFTRPKWAALCKGCRPCPEASS